MACCLSNGFFSVISLLGFGMARGELAGEQQQVGAGRREETAAFKAEGPWRLWSPAQDCQGFQIFKEANLLPFSWHP